MIQRKPAGFIKDAIFLSHTTLKDFLNCPKAFYLKNIYRDPRHNYKLQLASPYLTLGALVHNVIKNFLENKQQTTLITPEEQFRNFWQKYRGKRGGFNSIEEEVIFGKRGLKMLENFQRNYSKLDLPLPLIDFPKYPLVDNVVLHGNMDYVGQRPDGSLHVIDFKTGSKDEDSAIQLYIYAILAENNYNKEVSKASFWYLDRDDTPKEVVLDPLEPQIDWLVEKGLEVKKAIEENVWVCKNGDQPCRDCRDYTAILEGKGEHVFSDDAFKKEVYFLPKDIFSSPLD